VGGKNQECSCLRVFGRDTAKFKARYAWRVGVESSLSQGIRRFDVRRSHDIGLACTHLQRVLIATAMNAVGAVAWLWNEPLDRQKRRAGHFARLAPHPLPHQALISEGVF
jgi:transposase